MSSDGLLARPVVPVAGAEDADSTYSALVANTVPGHCRPFVVHVIDDTEGSDGIEPQHERAHDALERFESRAAADGMAIDAEIVYGKPIAETILEVAEEADGSAIVFCSRGGSAWFDLLVGGVRTSLLVKSSRPVVMLPVDEA